MEPVLEKTNSPEPAIENNGEQHGSAATVETAMEKSIVEQRSGQISLESSL